MYGGNGHFQYSKGNNSKNRKSRAMFMCSACRLMVFNICVKFHENMSSSFKVMEQTRKLLRHTHTERTKTIYPIAYFICQGYNQRYGSCVVNVVSWFNICVKFHENMSSSFKVMERTRKLLTHKGQ